jgi:predicted transcriptional regulator
MTKSLDQAIAKVRELPELDQDALALALRLLSVAASNASAFPLDEQARTAIRDGLAQAERGEFVADEIITELDEHHGL